MSGNGTRMVPEMVILSIYLQVIHLVKDVTLTADFG